MNIFLLDTIIHPKIKMLSADTNFESCDQEKFRQLNE